MQSLKFFFLLLNYMSKTFNISAKSLTSHNENTRNNGINTDIYTDRYNDINTKKRKIISIKMDKNGNNNSNNNDIILPPKKKQKMSEITSKLNDNNNMEIKQKLKNVSFPNNLALAVTKCIHNNRNKIINECEIIGYNIESMIKIWKVKRIYSQVL